MARARIRNRAVVGDCRRARRGARGRSRQDCRQRRRRSDHDARGPGLRGERGENRCPPGDPTADPTFKEGLKGLIAQKLLAEEVKKYDDKIDEDQIDKYIADVEQERNITDQQLKQSLMQNGVSWDDFRKQAKTELEKAMMLNEELRQHVTIPPEQIQAYYDAHQRRVHRQAGEISSSRKF